ncbi:MAG TPA: hypothetical protein ENK23_00950 [Sorangium sp.]|nr:hypothetical protein [Sorangium sp.]
MRLFTDGKSVSLRTIDGIVSWAPKAKPTLRSMSGLGVPMDARGGLMVVTPSGVDLTKALEALKVLDAHAVSDDEVVALLDGGESARLASGPPGEWLHELSLAGIEATSVVWPKGLLWPANATQKTIFAEAKGAGFPVELGRWPELTVNRHGQTITSHQNGMVAVLRPGDDDIDFGFRVPVKGRSRLYAEATAQGALVTLHLPDGNAAVVHVGEDGTLLGVHSMPVAAPAVLIGDFVALFDQREQLLRLMDLTLKPKTKKALPFDPCEARASADNKVLALANADHIALIKVSAKGRMSVAAHVNYGEVLSVARERAAEKRRRNAYDPKRAHGAPGIGFPVGAKPPPWIAMAGAPLELELLVRSAGGKGRGMYLMLEGAALQHLKLSHVQLGATEAPFQEVAGGLRAEIPDVELVEGLRYPLDPSPKNDKHKYQAQHLLAATHFSLTVHGETLAPSRELLRVTMGALEEGASPMKWMRPFIIEAPAD